MAVTHPDFLTRVRSYAEVDSNVLSDSLIDGYIRNVELDVAGRVDYDDIRKYATSNFNANKRFLQMPSAFLVIRSLQVFADSTLTSARTFMEKKDTSFITEFNGSGATGKPKYYANWDDNSVVVAPTPDQAYATQLNYIIDPPHFNSSTATYLSNNQESLLLHGVLTECFSFLKGPEDMYNLYKQKYNEEIQQFAMQQMGQRKRGQYEDGVPRMPIPSPSPNAKGVG